MATQVSNNIVRPKVDIPPGIWGDMFLDCPTKEIDTATQSRHKELREQVRKMFVYSPMDNSNQKLQLLHLIDAVQRLGIGYHFEKEIEDALKHVYHDKNIDAENDLYTTALRFRLLREHGFRVSCETFNNFKDKKGNFKSVLTSDVRGLLELYEASYMRVHGEDILDEAIAFTTAQLALAAESLDHPTNLKEKVTHALKQSLRRGIRRVEARHYISVYQDEESYNKELLEFAKIDFNMLQLLYRKELSEICRWWKDSEFTTKLPYVRDRVVECYFWVMGIDFEPHYSLGRRFLSKVIAMISVFDDTYDSYGTYDELEICTDAIERWDIKCMDQLPDYMKVSYKALLEVYQEMEEQLADQGQQYRVEYARKAMIQLAQAYLLEAKWTQENCKPTFEEFKGNALTTSSYALLSVAAFAGMGDVVTEETYKWAFTDPKIIRASKIICRFVDDITEHKFKQKRDDDFSSVELYMEEYGVSAQEAYDELNKHIESSWKDINQELLKPTEMPTPILNPCLDLARPMDALYTEGDGYTNVGRATKTGITSVLIDLVLL